MKKITCASVLEEIGTDGASTGDLLDSLVMPYPRGLIRHLKFLKLILILIGLYWGRKIIVEPYRDKIWINWTY